MPVPNEADFRCQRYLRWQGFGQVVININFAKLPRTAVHDLNPSLKGHCVVEDEDGEGKRVLELLKRKPVREDSMLGRDYSIWTLN